MGISRAQRRHRRDNRGAWQVEVEIGQLVLDGFERIDCDAVGSAFSRELDRLLRQGARALAAGGTAGIELASRVACLPGTQLPAELPSRRLGQALAGIVFSIIEGAGTASNSPAAAARPLDARRPESPPLETHHQQAMTLARAQSTVPQPYGAGTARR
jgi:hypothetical protein